MQTEEDPSFEEDYGYFVFHSDNAENEDYFDYCYAVWHEHHSIFNLMCNETSWWQQNMGGVTQSTRSVAGALTEISTEDEPREDQRTNTNEHNPSNCFCKNFPYTEYFLLRVHSFWKGLSFLMEPTSERNTPTLLNSFHLVWQCDGIKHYQRSP